MTACVKYIKEKYVDIKTALVALPFAIISSFLSTRLILNLDDKIIGIIIMICIPIAVVLIFLRLRFTSKAVTRCAISKRTVALSALAGIILGTYDALFGPGGGTIAMIVYMLFLDYDLRVGCGNGKIIIVVSNITAVISYILSGYMIYYIAIPCSIANMLGSYIGAMLAIKKGSKIMLPTMIFVIVCVIIQCLFNFAQ